MRGLFWRLRLRGFFIGWLHGLLVGLGTAGFLAGLAVLWPEVARALVPIAAGTAALATLITWWPLRSRRHLAQLVFRKRPQHEDLLSAVELEQKLPEDLLSQLHQQVAQQSGQILQSLRPWPWAWRWLAGGWGAALLLTALSPYGALRAVYTALGEPWPLTPAVQVLPYSTAVFAGETVPIVVETWQVPEPPLLVFDVVDTLHPLRADTLRHRYHFERLALVPGLQHFQAIAGPVQSRPCTLRVYQKPLIQGLRARVIFPRYTGWPPETLQNPYELRVLQGSRVILQGRLVAADSARATAPCLPGPMVLPPDTPFTLSLPALTQPCSLGFTYYRKGLQRTDSTLVRILVTRDLPPRMVLLAPRGTVDLPEDEHLPVLAYAEDDWGLAGIRAVVRVHGGESRFPLKSLQAPGITLDTLRLRMDLTPFNLLPGEEMTLILEARDRAGQVGQSDPLVIRFPSLEDVYAETEAALDAQEQGTAVLQEKAQELTEKLRELNESFKAHRKLDWSTREKVQSVIRQQEQLLQNLQQQAQQMQKALQQLDALSSIDPELAEKARRVAQLFQEVASEELAKALKRLQEALRDQNPRRLEQVLQQLQQNQEILKARLERLEQVLERFRREMKLAELEERLGNLAEQQARLREQTTQARTPEAQQALAQQQQALERELESLRQEMDTLAQDLAEEAPTLAESLQSVADSLAPQAMEAMAQARMDLSQQNPSAAQGKQQQAFETLLQMKQRLASLRNQLGQQQRQEVVQRIRRIRRDLLFLARQQAQLLQSLQDPAGPLHPEEAARTSQALSEALEPVQQAFRQLMSQTLILSSTMLNLLDRIRTLQQDATRALSQGAYRPARDQARAAYSLLNRTLLLLFQAEKQAQQSGSGTGVEQMLQQLEQLASGQMQINQATQSLLPLPSPVPGEMMARLQQLAEQQRALREALEKLQQALQQGTGLEQALEGARQAMEQVEQALRQGTLTPQVRRNQEKALERLLQAERALRKREFARRRRSTPGRSTEPAAVAPLERATLRDQARRLLLELQRQPGATGYRALTEAYLRTLLRLLNR